MINGWCFGGAFQVLLACDLAIADEDATFGLSEINWGIIPAGNVTRAVAQALRSITHVSPDFAFVVSPLQRARQTMGYIAEALALEPEQVAIEPAVTELGFGVWEGKPFWELKASPIYPPHPEDRYSWRPEAGESYEDGHARINRWLDTLDRPTVVVAHGAIGRCLIAACNPSAARRATMALPARLAAACHRVQPGDAHSPLAA